jgi:hypothetical protein
MLKHQLSHMDHGFTQDQWSHIFAKYADKKEFFIDTFELPEGLGTVTDELYGPSAGDAPVLESEVHYARRGERAWDSRLVARPMKPTRFVRVIAGPHEEKCSGCGGSGQVLSLSLMVQFGDGMHTCPACHGDKVSKYPCILYTAYGVARLDMPAAPKEPGDLDAQLLLALAADRDARAAWLAAGKGLGPTYDAYRDAIKRVASVVDDLGKSILFWMQHALAHEVP